MAEGPRALARTATQSPLILILSQNDQANSHSWPARWEAKRDDCRCIDPGMWDNPHRNTWVNKLNLAIHHAGRPVVIVAYGLGCVTAAWWAEYERPAFGDPVVGALLVSPPDVDRPGRDPRLARFGACPRKPLPFPSFLVASRDDPQCPFTTAVSLARDWGSRFAYAGDASQPDFASQPDLDRAHGDWNLGERLLDRLIAEASDALSPDPGCRQAAGASQSGMAWLTEHPASRLSQQRAGNR